jgi:transposase InsO family protein
LCDRPRVPHQSPYATPRAVVSKILYLRQRYHFGPGRTANYLKRFHHLAVARSTVHRILVRYGMDRLPANQKPRPTGTAIDDCTRIRVLKIYDACNQASAIRFVDEVIRRLPFRVLVVQTDNGAEFQSGFHGHLEEQDIRHVYIRPRTPHLSGKVERSHRVDQQEFYQLLDKDGIADDIHLFNDKLREWEDYYNYHRPHGALDGQTPYERLLAKKASARVSPKS